MKPFPVYHLNHRITEAISKIVSIGIAKGIEEGLDPQIDFVDETGGPLTTVAEINEIPDYLKPEYKHKVTVSAAFMQILWIICDIAFRNNDAIAIEVEIEKMNADEREEYFRELEIDTPLTNHQRNLLDKKAVFQDSAEKVDLIELILTKHLSEAEMELLYSRFDMSSDTGILANSMYTYAMTFCLLHEFSHHSLGQDFNTEGTVADEIAADQEAFWSMFCDLDGKHKETAMYGIISLLVSLIFVNKELLDDGIHPLPIERIFDYYELIKDDNPKYAGLLCHLFYTWAVYAKDNDMPKWDRPYNEMLDLIKAHLLEREKAANI